MSLRELRILIGKKAGESGQYWMNRYKTVPNVLRLSLEYDIIYV